MENPSFEFLELSHRQVLLDLVLTWASIDVSIGYLASAFLPNTEPAVVARILGKRRASAKLREIQKLVQHVSTDASVESLERFLKKSKKNLERHGEARDHLAHSLLIGWSENNPDFLAFLKFEAVENNLASYEVPFAKFEAALNWGLNFDHALRQIIRASKAREQDTESN
ncbi:hypothetical protein JYP51_05135 [Ponticoccus gilvus]|nr:hypothetical protein [Enemella evansiae]